MITRYNNKSIIQPDEDCIKTKNRIINRIHHIVKDNPEEAKEVLKKVEKEIKKFHN